MGTAASIPRRNVRSSNIKCCNVVVKSHWRLKWCWWLFHDKIFKILVTESFCQRLFSSCLVSLLGHQHPKVVTNIGLAPFDRISYLMKNDKWWVIIMGHWWPKIRIPTGCTVKPYTWSLCFFLVILSLTLQVKIFANQN